MLNLFVVLVLLLLHGFNPAIRPVLCSCRTSCNGIPIKYPFGIDDGCGAPQFRHMLNCSAFSSVSSVSSPPNATSSTVIAAPAIGGGGGGGGGETLFFTTPSGNYKVQSIDYTAKTMSIYDPGMSTCSILQPHHDFLMTDLQAAIIPPSSDTIFVLVNCSVDSPVLNHYKNLCFDNFAGHSCNELYTSCNSFKLFHMSPSSSTSYNASSPSPPDEGATPPCCFTGYDTVRYMSMNILDCTHYTSVYNTEDGQLKGLGPQDWTYGMKLSYGTPPETGCSQCEKSGGVCGFDVETQGMTCICNMAVNATRECAPGTTQSKAPTGMIQWPISFMLSLVAMLVTFGPIFS